MSVKYRVQQFGPRKDKWWFRIVHRQTVTLREMAQFIEDASALTAIDVLSAVGSLAIRLQMALARGDRVKIDGIGTFSLSARGLTDDSEAQLDTQQLDIVFLPAPQLRRYVRQHAGQERETARLRAPRPTRFTDAATKRDDVYTPNAIAKIHGHTLKFDPDDVEQGVFFQAEDGSEVRAAIYSHIGDKWVHCLIPAGLVGMQRVIVRAQPRFAPDVREGVMSRTVEAV